MLYKEKYKMTRKEYNRLSGIDIEGLINKVSSYYDVDVKSNSRDRYASDIRKMFCGYLYSTTRLTLHNISEIVNRSVGNISYYMSTHDKEMGGNEAYADRYADFQGRMKEESVTI